MNGWQLRSLVEHEEIDYVQLMGLLGKYANPRKKIQQFLKDKVLIRVKKGLYVFGPEYARQPYFKEVLANQIYGPSAISLEYALGYYGMIPERVVMLTSITTKRNKRFDTPVGRFTYRYLHPKKYSVGLTQLMLNDSHPILIATPEKAIADVLTIAQGKPLLNTQQELIDFLYDDLRIDPQSIENLDIKLMYEIADNYKHTNINLLLKYLAGLNNG